MECYGMRLRGYLLAYVFRGLSWMSVEGDMEAGVGIEPAYTALQAAA